MGGMGKKKPNPYKPIEVLYFRRPGQEELCRIEAYTDGSALVTGGVKAAEIYEVAEGADNYLERAIQAVEQRGYVRVSNPHT
jgi:hypothetical protein